jgi:hypothetical protein
LIVALFVTDLELSFVEDFHDDLILSESLERVLNVFLFCKFPLLNIGKDFLDLKYLGQIALLLRSPIHNLIVITGKLELLSSLFQPDYCYIGEQLLVHWVFNH